MRKLLILMIVEILLLQGFSTASTISDFGAGQNEATASLRSTECSDVINITLPAECHVLTATVNVSTVAPDASFPDGPVNATVMLNDTILYSFNGTGYGGFGKQSMFNDGNSTIHFELGSGGGNGSTAIRLPQTAIVQSSSMDITTHGSGILSMLWNRTGPPGDAAVGLGYAGDVNNDGYDDFLVGAPYNSTKGSNTGTAYLFYGNSTVDSIEDVLFVGNASGDYFAYEVHGVGDLNGDGYSDIAILSPMDDTGAVDAGALYVYFGGDPMDNVSDLVLTGDHSNQWFGQFFAGGDVNGDGYDDLIVNAHPDFDQGTNEYGDIYIYYGGKTMDTTPDVILVAPEPDSRFYILPQRLTDLNGDGYDDVLVGAGASKIDGIYYGAAYIFFGGQNMDNVTDLTFCGTVANGAFGSVGSAGDINGDGYDDILIADTEWMNSSMPGTVFLYFGGPNIDTDADLIITGHNPGDCFGLTADIAGDFNKDGFDDIVINAIYDNSNGTNSGTFYVFCGGPEMDTVPDYIWRGETDQMFGWPLSYGGDINNDGQTEIIAGLYLNVSAWEGEVRIFTREPGLLNSTISLGASLVSNETGYFEGKTSVQDYSTAINDYLKTATVSGKDAYGNSFVDIPISISAECEGNLTLSNLSVVYTYNTTTLEFSDALNSYITDHKMEKDSNGNITIPIKVLSSTPGRLKLSDLQITLDDAPKQTDNIPDVIMNEDTNVSDLVDLQQYFKDDYDQAGQLTCQVVSFTNDTIVNVSITSNRYLSVDALTGPQNDNWTGTVDVIVKCSDRWNSTTVSNQFRVTVQNVPDPPAFISPPPTNATAGIEYQYQVMAVDGDNDPLTYVLVDKPLDMTMNPQTGLVNWIPRIGGDYLISIMLSDGRFNVFQNFSINVPNQQPKINSSANVTAIKGVPYEYLVNATDADGDTLAFSLVSDVPGMTIDAQKGNLSWTPESTGDFIITIMVADSKGGTAIQEFLVHVYEKIEPKMDFVTLPEQAVVGGNVAVSGRIIKGSLDIVTVQYRLDSGEWVNVTGNETWEINLDTTQIPNGEHKLEVRVFDGITYTDVGTRTFTVKNPVKESTGQFPTVVIGVITILAVIAGVLLVRTRKRPPDEEE